jgi:hypothetical protein
MFWMQMLLCLLFFTVAIAAVVAKGPVGGLVHHRS